MIDREQLAQIVQTWQRPIYNFAVRWFGRCEDADDVTQEIFAALARKYDQYDAREAFRPWLFKLALHTIYNHARARATRRRHEEKAMPPEPAPLVDPLEERELRVALEQALLEIPDDERALVLMHYYSGLSQLELAAALALPRTTVQSQLKGAVEELRRRLKSSGHVATFPALEFVMRATPALEVPGHLAQSLASFVTASTVAGPALATGVAVTGAFVVNKVFIASAVLLGLLCLGGGFVVSARKRAEEAALRSQDASAASAVLARDLDKLAAALAAAEDESKRLKLENAGLAARLAAADAVLAAKSSEPELASAQITPAASQSPQQVDWRRVAELMTANLDVIERSINESDDELTAADRARMSELQAEFMKLERYALTVTDLPFFDPELLQPFLLAITAQPLGLDAKQTTQLHELIAGLSAEHLENFDAANSVPAERFATRDAVLNAFQQGLEQISGESQLAALKTVSSFANSLLRGSRDELRFGAEVDKPEPLIDATMKEWSRSFKFDGEQDHTLRSHAENFARAALGLLKKYRDKAGGVDLPAADQLALDQELLALQIEEERRLANQLSPAHRERLRTAVPAIFRLSAPGENTTMRNRGMSF
ncbi:MAG: RNA polymerase sigma factor [Planctomycetota bacterium]